jgi:hypothetical protein
VTLVSSLDLQWQFAGWYDFNRELHVGRIERGVQRWGVDHDEVLIAGAPRTAMAMPVEPDNEDTGHRYLSIAVDGLGRLHAWCNMHAEPMRAIKTTAAHTTDGWLNPDMSGWASANADFGAVAQAGSNTYHLPLQWSDGDLFFLDRSDTSGAAGMANTCYWTRGAASTTWSARTMIFQGLSVPDGKGPGVAGDGFGVNTPFNWSAYPSVCIEPEWAPNPDRLHLFWTWRLADGTARPCGPNYYVYTDDKGATWRDIQGGLCTLPFTPLNNIPARLPGHARILSMSRASNLVFVAVDSSASFVNGDTYHVFAPSDTTYTGTFVVSKDPLGPNTLGWAQTAADDPAGGLGWILRDDTSEDIAMCVDDQGRPHIFGSLTNAVTPYTRWDGTQWVRQVLGASFNGLRYQSPLNLVWHRGELMLLAQGRTNAEAALQPAPARRPVRLNSMFGDTTVRLGGNVGYDDVWGGQCYDRTLYRKTGAVEVLIPDGDRPLVYGFGNHAFVQAAA